MGFPSCPNFPNLQDFPEAAYFNEFRLGTGLLGLPPKVGTPACLDTELFSDKMLSAKVIEK